MIFGYLDPGSGSLILQAVIGGLTGIGVAYKAYRARRGAREGRSRIQSRTVTRRTPETRLCPPSPDLPT